MLAHHPLMRVINHSVRIPFVRLGAGNTNTGHRSRRMSGPSSSNAVVPEDPDIFHSQIVSHHSKARHLSSPEFFDDNYYDEDDMEDDDYDPAASDVESDLNWLEHESDQAEYNEEIWHDDQVLSTSIENNDVDELEEEDVDDFLRDVEEDEDDDQDEDLGVFDMSWL